MANSRIMSIDEIARLLRIQAALRAPENDEAGILLELREQLLKQVDELELPTNRTTP